MASLTGMTITKISEVTDEVTLFFRSLGLSNYYIIKIFDLVGDSAVSLTEDDPYWLLDEFPRMGFKAVDEIAFKLGFSGENPMRLKAGVRQGLRTYTGEGHSYAPKHELSELVSKNLDVSMEIVSEVMEDMTFDGDIQLSRLDGEDIVYFYGYYKAECAVCKGLSVLENAHKFLKPVGKNIDSVIKKQESKKGIALSNLQRDAVKNSLLSGVSVITGGPGTGKTTIIDMIVSVLKDSGQKVRIAAPTGRAAKRIMETSGFPAVTVHRLLEYYYDDMAGCMRFKRNQSNPVSADAVIIDEASMLDIMLAEALLNALTPGTRLILVGDSDQLPSVGAGNVLSDIISSDFYFTTRLNEVFRQEEQSGIVINAHRINMGDYPVFSTDFEFVEKRKQDDIAEEICRKIKENGVECCQVLTPSKKGIVGAAELNKKLQERFNPESPLKDELKFGSRIFRVGDRVMHIKNNYQLEYKLFDTDGDELLTGKGIFNGEIGIVKGIDKDAKSVTVVYDDEKWVVYPYVNLEELEHAYAITVHKSQGSEFANVIIPVTWFHPGLLQRSLIYTGVTRARSKVILIGEEKYLRQMVENNVSRKRNSGLKTRILDCIM